MIQRGADVIMRLGKNVRHITIKPLLAARITPCPCLDTDEDEIYGRLEPWGYSQKTVCHASGEYARDDDGDGVHEVHVDTMEGFWSRLRSWLRPHRGIAQGNLPRYVGCFAFVHHVRRRGKALLGTSLDLLLPSSPKRILSLLIFKSHTSAARRYTEVKSETTRETLWQPRDVQTGVKCAATRRRSILPKTWPTSVSTEAEHPSTAALRVTARTA
jgi:transposase